MRPLLTVLVLCAGCTATGNVQVFIEAEDTIPSGLSAGPGDEQIVDGWSVRYDKFLLGFGNVHASRSSKPAALLAEPKLLVIDMKALPEGGFVFADWQDVEATRWDRFGFSLVEGDAEGIQKADATSDADFALMQAGGYSVYFEATLENPAGQSCRPGVPTDCVPRTSMTVRFGVPAATSFDDCAPPEGQAGFAVPSGGTVQVKPTIHGDHWFFSNLTQGTEVTKRRAQWIIDCDLDRSGETTIDELKQCRAADVFAANEYNLTGALDSITSAYDYLLTQARTLGDYQGEGECPTRKKL